MNNEERVSDKLNSYLTDLRLPAIKSHYQDLAQQAIKNELTYEQYLYDLMEVEYEQRWNNRIQRNLRHSELPLDKTLELFEMKRIPMKVRQQFQILLSGDFLRYATNVLAFGLPGTGKTHLLCALCHELTHKGYKIIFYTTAKLVEALLTAKRQLELAKFIKKLSKFDAILIDDIGYVKQSRDEMEVLFTLLAERYESGSVLITSNLPFSKWDQIFQDPMTTAAAIDRVVHHSVILELNISSYRMEAAKTKKEECKTG